MKLFFQPLQNKVNWTEWYQSQTYDQCFILVDSNTEKHCLPLLRNLFPKDATILKIKAGESSKEISTATQLWDKLLKKGATRRSVLICIGGGVVCDLGGFVAASYFRGIDCIYFPTTLMAQVDAAYGGKTAINSKGIKNSIGFFKMPTAIAVEEKLLKTLPEQQILNAWAEIIKHALIQGPEIWKLLPKSKHSSSSVLKKWIPISVEFKQMICEQDPLEKDIRKALNLGHTIGHAIEAVQKKQSHGRCVLEGLWIETLLSMMLCHLDITEGNEILSYLSKFGAPPSFTQAEIKAILKHLRYDKKNSHGQVKFILLSAIGDVNIGVPCSEEEVKDVLYCFCQ
jgi:3-dehydroquinate synthase